MYIKYLNLQIISFVKGQYFTTKTQLRSSAATTTPQYKNKMTTHVSTTPPYKNRLRLLTYLQLHSIKIGLRLLTYLQLHRIKIDYDYSRIYNSTV